MLPGFPEIGMRITYSGVAFKRIGQLLIGLQLQHYIIHKSSMA